MSEARRGKARHGGNQSQKTSAVIPSAYRAWRERDREALIAAKQGSKEAKYVLTTAICQSNNFIDDAAAVEGEGAERKRTYVLTYVICLRRGEKESTHSSCVHTGSSR